VKQQADLSTIARPSTASTRDPVSSSVPLAGGLTAYQHVAAGMLIACGAILVGIGLYFALASAFAARRRSLYGRGAS